ncbi:MULTISPECIES: MG284/MPN403 family protein [Terrabacteria group]|uniref:MG284/MPN403 family protein n=1 Tax=Bacillati TaxID=1783272 RepID=UPI00193ACD55|nr:MULTISPECIES: hypothetical protein [Terrabacteria group]MBW9212284.1 hypothetical protein [Trueperella sp. zg.1013]QRG86177.1 hypothetical protein JOS54_04700 [Bulleidia sp. zg-1006]
MCIQCYQDQQRILMYVGQAYQCCKKKFQRSAYDEQFLNLIEKALMTCSTETNWIIRYDYLEKKKNNWYMEYFAKSSYYRLKKVAIVEFLNCLELS